MTTFTAWAWAGFTALILGLLVLDLLVLARGSREISFRRATILSLFWIVLALLFGAVVFALAGPARGGEYFAGYVIEKSLSVDNVFVFALIFSYFAVPARYQYRILFWGSWAPWFSVGSSPSRRAASSSGAPTPSRSWG